jgi:hypothetical protein
MAAYLSFSFHIPVLSAFRRVVPCFNDLPVERGQKFLKDCICHKIIVENP